MNLENMTPCASRRQARLAVLVGVLRVFSEFWGPHHPNSLWVCGPKLYRTKKWLTNFRAKTRANLRSPPPRSPTRAAGATRVEFEPPEPAVARNERRESDRGYPEYEVSR